MKVSVLLLSLLMVPVVSNAQTPAASSTGAEVQVQKFSWSKERLNWEQNPFNGPNENLDRKSTRLNSSYSQISYAVFCLKKKKKTIQLPTSDIHLYPRQ